MEILKLKTYRSPEDILNFNGHNLMCWGCNKRSAMYSRALEVFSLCGICKNEKDKHFYLSPFKHIEIYSYDERPLQEG